MYFPPIFVKYVAIWLLIRTLTFLGLDGQSPPASEAVVGSVTRLIWCLARAQQAYPIFS